MKLIKVAGHTAIDSEWLHMVKSERQYLWFTARIH